MATVEELRQWCETSRLLLKTTRKLVGDSKRSKTLQAHLDRITELLPAILFWKPRVYRECFAEFQRLQQLMDAQARGLKKNDTDQKNTIQDDLNREFGALEERLQQTTREMNEDNARRQALAKARGAYRAEHEKALGLLNVVGRGATLDLTEELDRIDRQTAQDTVDAYDIGVKAIKALLPRIEKARELGEKFRQGQLAQVAQRPLAEKKLEEARQRFAGLEGLLGIEPRLAEFRAILGEAGKQAAAGAWIQVLAALEKLDKLPKDGALQKDSQAQVRSLSELPRFTEGQGYVEQLAALVPPDEAAPYRTGFQAVANLLLSQTVVKQASLTVLSDAVENLKSELQRKKGLEAAVQQQSQALTNRMGEARELIAPLDLLKQQTAFDNYAALYSGKQLQAAWTLGESLQEELEALLPSRRQARDDWLKRRTVAANLDQQLAAMIDSPCTAVTQRLATVRQWVTPKMTQPLEEQHDYVRLVAGLDKARPEVAELKRLHDGFLALQGPRADADQEIEQRVKALTPLLAELDKASNQAQKDQGESLFDTTKRLRADIASLRAVWQRASAAATDPKAFESAHADALRGLQDIEETARASASPQGLARLALERRREVAGQAFNQKWPEFERLQRQAQALDNATAERLAGLGRTLQTRAPVDWIAGLEQLDLLIEDAKGAVAQAGHAREALQGRVQSLAAEVRLEIERVKKASRNSKTFADAFASLEDERRQLQLQGGSSNVEAILDAEQGLQALKVRATKFAPPQGDTSGQSIDKVMQTLELAEEQLEKARKKLEDNHPKGLVNLAERLVQLKKDVYAAEPAQGFEKIAAFTQAVNAADAAADKVIEVRGQFDQLLPTVEQSCLAFKTRKLAPEYTKQLDGRLDAVRKQRKDPTKLYQALTSLQTLDDELKAAAADVQVALGKEKGVRDARHQDEVNAKLYERTLKVCKDRWMPEARQAVRSSGGDSALPLELERMVETAEVTKKQGDLARALHQVEMTVERAKQIIADPFGPAIGSRNNLPKDNRVWRDAVAAFQGALDIVRDKTLEAAPQAHESVRRKLQQMLEGVKVKVDPNHFEGALRALGDPGARDGARRAAREAALARVRGVQAALAANPQVILLLQNPAAGKEFSLGYRRLQSALTRLDANISRCVR